MTAYQVSRSGECGTCNEKTKEEDILQCYDCKSIFHAICGDERPFGNKTLLGSFKKAKVSNYLFVCNMCLTKRENNEASTLEDRIEALTAKVDRLVGEFQVLKAKVTFSSSR